MGLFKDLILSKKTLTDKLLDEISDYDIYCELSGVDIEIGKPINSPVREDDNPSFSLFIPTETEGVREDEVWWRDFTGGWGNVFQFVKDWAEYHQEVILETRKDVVMFLDEELCLGIFKGEKGERKKREVDFEAAKLKRDIFFTSRPFTRRDKFWWAEIAIDEELLKEHDVRSIQHLLGEDYEIRYTYRQSELAYAIVVYDKVKIYNPESKDFKWRNTCPANYIMGAAQCKRDDVLIITKSMKDILCFKSLIHCDAISAQSENFVYTEEILERIKSRYKEVYVVMDYDEAGIQAAERLKEHGFNIVWVSTKRVLVDGKYVTIDKDISDYIRNHGISSTMDHLQTIFYDLPKEQFRVDRVNYFKELMSSIIND